MFRRIRNRFRRFQIDRNGYGHYRLVDTGNRRDRVLYYSYSLADVERERAAVEQDAKHSQWKAVY